MPSAPNYHGSPSNPHFIEEDDQLAALKRSYLSSAGRHWGLFSGHRVHSALVRVPGHRVASRAAVDLLRGGAAVNDDDEYDETTDSDSDEYDDEEDDVSLFNDSEEDEDEYDEYDEEDEEDGAAVDADPMGVAEAEIEYDTPYAPSFVQQMGSTVGVMVLCRKIDLFDPKVVRMVRIAFILYAVMTQFFVAYVRIRAKLQNDRTPITINNPVSSLLQKQLPESGGGKNDMVKNIASQFLSSQSSVMEYDLKEAKKMGNALLFPLAILWFMHFKLGQVQPLLFQISSGFMNVLYSPLFQVYVLGRNLERPFKTPSNPMAERMEELQKQQKEAAEAAAVQATTADADDDATGGEDDTAGESADDGEVEDATDDEEYDEEESEEQSDEDKSSDYDSDEE